MAWRLSTGAKLALLGQNPSISAQLCAATISMGDGDGTGGTDTINDSGSGLGVFDVGDWVLIASGDANNNVTVKVLTATTAKLEVVAASFTAVAAGSNITLLKLASGSLECMMANGTMDIYSGTRPSSADLTESGTQLLEITLNGGTFVGAASENGLNLGTFSSTTIKRATDPATGTTEVWSGTGLADGTAGYARWYDNAYTTGASTTAVRMDGVVATSGGEVNMSNGTGVVTGVSSEVSNVEFTVSGV